MSLIYSNILAVIGVILLPLVGRRWVAPQFRPSTRRYFLLTLLWGAPFVVGQLSQADEWGPIWVQYHLLDLAFVPWATALVIATLSLGIRLARRMKRLPRVQRLSEKALIWSSFGAMFGFGIGSEVWDSWIDAGRFGISFWTACDIGDYATLTTGAVAAVALYTACQRQVGTRMAMS